MVEIPFAPAQYWSLFSGESAALLNAYARATTAEMVPACPGWTVARLGRHIGGIYHRTAKVLAEQLTEPPETEIGPESDDGVGAWLARGVQQLIEVFLLTDPAIPVWTMAGVQPGAFLARRLTHETMVHTFDLEALHRPQHRPAPLTIADGIDEFIDLQLVRKIERNRLPGFTGTLALDASDAATRFVVEITPERVIRRAATDEVDATVRGRAIDLILFLWHRNESERLTLEGKESLLSGLRDFVF